MGGRNGRRDPGQHPFALAAILAGAYVLLSGAYILISTRLAAAYARSVSHLQYVESLKGAAFVVVTGLAFLGFAYLLLRRLASQQARILEQQGKLVASERRAMAGLFAASLAHDINNLLQSVRSGLYLLTDPQVRTPGDTREEILADVGKALVDLTALSRRLATFERDRGAGAREPLDLKTLVNDSVDLARSHLNVRRCRISATCQDALILRGDPASLRGMMLNLILNAADAVEGRGRIEVRALREDDRALLEVHDDGPGIPPDRRQAVFGVFYTTKLHGTGLGLLSVRVAAEDHGGSVEVEASDLGGACLRVVLPLERSRQQQIPGEGAPALPAEETRDRAG